MMCARLWVVLAVLFCLLGVVAGCGGHPSGRAAVRGTISIDSAPLPNGVIEFVPLDAHKGQTGSASIEEGKYAIDAEKGLFPGEYRVAIRANRPTGKKSWDGMGDEKWPASKKNYVPVMESYIPAKYNDRSTLKETVELGKVNEFNFELQLGKK